MEIYNVSVKQEGENRFICLDLAGEELKISLTDENPQAIKEVFNKLILKLKQGLFNFKIENSGTDLFSEVAVEYIKHLNSELKSVHGELVHYSLLDDTVHAVN